jgi:hypothetical protein
VASVIPGPFDGVVVAQNTASAAAGQSRCPFVLHKGANEQGWIEKSLVVALR